MRQPIGCLIFCVGWAAKPNNRSLMPAILLGFLRQPNLRIRFLKAIPDLRYIPFGSAQGKRLRSRRAASSEMTHHRKYLRYADGVNPVT
jgi:hypothetical protein